MRYLCCALLLGAALSTPGAEAHGAPPATTRPGLQNAVVGAASVAPTPEQIAPLDAGTAERQALQAELARRVRRTQEEVAALQSQMNATTDDAQREALQQRIEAAKREGRLEFFRIQLRYAKAAGRMTQAEEIQAVIDAQMKMPVAPLRPLPQAAPEAAATASRSTNAGGR